MDVIRHGQDGNQYGMVGARDPSDMSDLKRVAQAPLPPSDKRLKRGTESIDVSTEPSLDDASPSEACPSPAFESDADWEGSWDVEELMELSTRVTQHKSASRNSRGWGGLLSLATPSS